MRTGQHAAVAAAATALALGLSACGHSATPPAAALSGQASGTTSPTSTAGPEPSPAPTDSGGLDRLGGQPDSDPQPDPLDDPFGEENHRTPLEQLWWGDQPDGSGPQIALRFLRALQAGDDLAAARELFISGRSYFAFETMATLHRVMRDVADHAQLPSAGLCTRAERLNDEAAVVSCGSRKVVVHVLHGYASGVQLSEWHPLGDVYPGPHTHAYTTYLY